MVHVDASPTNPDDGVVKRARSTATKLESTPHGCLATVSGASVSVAGDAVEVRDAKGALVFAYDAATGSMRVEAPTGDVVFAAPNGKVVLEAGVDVELTAKGEAKIHAQAIELVSGVAAIHAERLIERAKDAYREIDGLLHTRAGRVRSLVAGAYELFAKQTTVTSEEDTSIDGKRVLLG
jgi:hypothetical protein